MFLSKYAKEVYVMIRGDNLGAKMSDYLVQRLEASPKIQILKNTQVIELHGEHHLESITIDKGGEKEILPISNLYSFIGAAPNTSWMNNVVATDEKGFIYTGKMLDNDLLTNCAIYSNRKPQTLESSIPGIFAVGDVRDGSVKRVASAVGEGSMVISQIHQYLSEVSSN